MSVRSTWRRTLRAVPLTLAFAGFALTGPAQADNPAEVFELPQVEVIATTPLPGLGTALADVPANVQVFGNRDFARQRPLDLTGFLDRNANSVGVGSGQGNPYQQDLNFRGFAASPLLGTPQGISVFQDGVRINEAFGDVVNWDLLPRSAISTRWRRPRRGWAFNWSRFARTWPNSPPDTGPSEPGRSPTITGPR